MKRDEWRPTKYSVLCSAHFEKRCYRRPPGLELRALLKPDAVPSLFSTHLASAQESPATKRKAVVKTFSKPSGQQPSTSIESAPMMDEGQLGQPITRNITETVKGNLFQLGQPIKRDTTETANRKLYKLGRPFTKDTRETANTDPFQQPSKLPNSKLERLVDSLKRRIRESS